MRKKGNQMSITIKSVTVSPFNFFLSFEDDENVQQFKQLSRVPSLACVFHF